MLNSLCRCFYFWQDNEDDVNLNDSNDRITSLQRPEVCLDITRSGELIIF
jgi:hypothetical protein